MDRRVDAALRGIGAEIPFVRGYIESLDSAEQNRLLVQFEHSKISSLNDLVAAVNRLNPNMGRGLEIREAWSVRRPYHYREKTSHGSFTYREHFDKDSWDIETIKCDDKEWFDSFAVYVVFNNDERGTTVTDLTLKFWSKEREVMARLDRAKEGDGKWRTLDPLEYSVRVPNNASVKLFLRYVSPELIEGVDVPSHIQLGHTSGLAQRMLTIQKLDPVPDGHWAAKSDGGRSVGVGVLSRW